MNLKQIPELEEIQTILKSKSSKEARESWKKFVPTAKKAYGVSMPLLNGLASKYKGADFPLVEALWKSGWPEEQILAAKILAKICGQDAGKALQLIEKFAKGISDWVACDTLATQGIRAIAKEKQKEIFALSKKLIKSENFWKRRFAIVLLINFAKDNNLKSEIGKIISAVENDKEHYVKKAIVWLKRELKK